MTQHRHGKQPNRSDDPPRASEPALIVKENRHAHSALSRLKQADRETAFRLLLLYGPSGIGKSQLVRQFLSEVRRSNPKLRLRNTTASEFDVNLNEAQSRQGQAEFEA